MSGYVPNVRKEVRDAELKNRTPTDVHKERWADYENSPTSRQSGSTTSAKAGPTSTKNKIILRIGVFFDGTGNNSSNTASGLACGAHHPVKPEDLDASCKPYMSDPDSSYGNDITNVKKLSELYYAPRQVEGNEDQRILFRSIYVEGIGTEAGKEDNLIGSGMGRGATGVANRVAMSFASIRTEINAIQQELPDYEIRALVFDAFGFSRGAAAARHFANEVALGSKGPLGDVMRSGAKAFSRTFVDQYHRDISMGFIGLFDTVASIAGLANMGNGSSSIAPGLNLYLPRAKFPNVLHLVARDEHRSNFPLTRVKPDHPEIALPGVHSDIGGGYLVEATECVLIGPMQALTVAMNTDVKSTSIYRDAQHKRNQLISEGWQPELLEIVTPRPSPLPTDPQDRMAPKQQRVYAGLQLKRVVRGELSRVYFRVMYERAKQKGVRFDDIPDAPQYLIPSELQSLCDRFVAGDYSTTESEESLLKFRYIHTSAHWNHPLGKQGNRGLKVVYINAPTADSIRVQHPHAPGMELM